MAKRSSKADPAQGLQVIAVNRKARHDFFILETYEAGLELKGCEVKSIRQGGINLKEGYVQFREGQAFLEGVHVSPYEHTHNLELSPTRVRRLLLHRREIRHLGQEVQQKRLTVLPLRVYFKRGRGKLEIGLARSKKKYDKRESIKERETKRILERTQRMGRGR